MNAASQTVALVAPNHPALRTVADEVTNIAEQVTPLVDEMMELMRAKGGIGLAAPQVGVGLRFFITGLAGLRVVINPTIKAYQNGRTAKPEGCLSFPGRETYVARAHTILVEFTDLRGHRVDKALHGWDARVFQHENDHLNGICIFK